MVLVEPLTMSISCSDHKLMAWLSPAYPIGSYSFSHGLEEAIASQIVTGKKSFFDWLFQILHFGSGRNEVIFVSIAYRSTYKELSALAEIVKSFAGTKERYTETLEQGLAFSKVTSAVFKREIPSVPLPVAVGYAAQIENIKLDKLLPLYLHSFAANLISAAVRFLPLGQTEGQIILSRLFKDFEKIGNQARYMKIDNLETSCILNDIGSMRHEIMKTRIFKS